MNKTIPQQESDLVARIKLYISCNERKDDYVYQATRARKRYKQQLLLLTSYGPFIEAISYFRKRWLPEDVHFSNLKTCLGWAKELSKVEAYDESLDYLLEYGVKDKKISKRWRNSIEYYILTGQSDLDVLLPKSVEVRFMPRPEDNKPGIFLEILPETELRDIREAWRSIGQDQLWHKQLADNHPLTGESEGEYWSFLHNQKWRHEKRYWDWEASKKNTLRNFDLYKRAYELKEEGKAMKEIRELLKEEGLLKGKNYGYEDMPNLVKRFEDALNANDMS